MTPPRGTYTTTPCRACRQPKPSRFYLCRECWGEIPPAERRALSARNDRAVAHARLRQLHDHIDAGHPLGELEITT